MIPLWGVPVAVRGSAGWLVCDDGAMESADFIHFNETASPPHLTLIHVKGSHSEGADRGLSVSDYEVVVGQAVKNIRHIDRGLLVEKLEANKDTQLRDAVWHNGERQENRDGVLQVLADAGQKVEFDPPATVNCDLAKALSEWVDAIQREAKERFGAAIAKLHASSYVCRNIYNRADPPLSQHALANAIDLSGFVLTSGEHITVREDWDNRSVDNRSLVHLASAAVSLPNVITGTQQRSEFVVSAHESACSIFGTVLGHGPIRRTEIIST